MFLTMHRTETVYSGLEGFPNNAQNANDISVVQDGYGLMISELLAGDFPNCPSVPGHIISMHNEMGLPAGEVHHKLPIIGYTFTSLFNI